MLVLRFGSDLAKCPGDDKRRPRKDQKDHKCRTGGVRYDYFVGGNFGRLVFELISLFRAATFLPHPIGAPSFSH